MALGLVLFAAAAWPFGLVQGAAVVVLAYGIVWEGLWQGLGAGLGDAAVDTFAVACGAALGAAAWQRRGPVVAGVIVAATAALAAGIRRRLPCFDPRPRAGGDSMASPISPPPW